MKSREKYVSIIGSLSKEGVKRVNPQHFGRMGSLFKNFKG
jgi:hypothetical protein